MSPGLIFSVFLGACSAQGASASAPQPAPLSEAEARIERGIRENSESARAFLEGATVYADADDLTAAAEARAKEWKSLVDRFWQVRSDIRRLRKELYGRRFGEAARAISEKKVADPLLNDIAGQLGAAERLEHAHKAVFKELQAGFKADAQALRGEESRRAGRRRTLMLCAWALGAAAAAGLLAVFLLKRRPAAPPPKKHPLALPRRKGPGRLQ